MNLKEIKIYQIARKIIKTVEYQNDSKKIIVNNSKKNIFIMGGIISGNIGDIAITVAEYTILNELSDYNVIVVSEPQYRWATDKIKNLVSDDDIIVITGGGFLGTEYPIMESFARNVINNFKNNKIIIFPQTIFYRTLDETIKNAYSHDDLTILCRDEGSMNYLKKYFPSNIKSYLAPDVVTYMDARKFGVNNKNIKKNNKALLILRKDSEKAINNYYVDLVKNILLENNYIIESYNTLTHKIVKDINSMRNVVGETIEYLSQYDFILTDRLHGMIFAAIANCKCLAIDNLTKKVSGVYEYIKVDNPQIKFLDTFNDNLRNEIVDFITKPMINCEYSNFYSKQKIKDVLKEIGLI